MFASIPYRTYHKGDLLAIQSLLQLLILPLLYKHRHTIKIVNVQIKIAINLYFLDQVGWLWPLGYSVRDFAFEFTQLISTVLSKTKYIKLGKILFGTCYFIQEIYVCIWITNVYWFPFGRNHLLKVQWRPSVSR